MKAEIIVVVFISILHDQQNDSINLVPHKSQEVYSVISFSEYLVKSVSRRMAYLHVEDDNNTKHYNELWVQRCVMSSCKGLPSKIVYLGRIAFLFTGTPYK